MALRNYLQTTSKTLIRLPRIPVLKSIKLYQATISPDHGKFKDFFPYGYCKYYPTCSEYGYQAIDKYGLIVGGSLAAWRIMRCNPFSNGGNDPVI